MANQTDGQNGENVRRASGTGAVQSGMRHSTRRSHAKHRKEDTRRKSAGTGHAGDGKKNASSDDFLSSGSNYGNRGGSIGAGNSGITRSTRRGRKLRGRKRRRRKTLILFLIAVLVVLLLALGIWRFYVARQKKFRDVTVELGTQTVTMEAFLTEYGNSRKAVFVSDVSGIDLGVIGETAVTLSQGGREETVTLRVVDTTPPAVQFEETIVRGLDYEPDPLDFIAEITDWSATTVRFEGEVPSALLSRPEEENEKETAAESAEAEEEAGWTEEFPAEGSEEEAAGEEEAEAEERSSLPAEAYEDVSLTVVVTDEGGNETRGVCTLSYTWLADQCVVELGEGLTKEDVLRIPGQGADFVDQEELDAICAQGVGEYTFTSRAGGKTVSCPVRIEDTKAPEVELSEVSVYLGESVSPEDFIRSVCDASGYAALHVTAYLPEGTAEGYWELNGDGALYRAGEDEDSVSDEGEDAGTLSFSSGEAGRYEVSVEAVDAFGNTVTLGTFLQVKADDDPPVFGGLSAVTLEKHSEEPDYLSGVTAVDETDGVCEITFDASQVNYDEAGVYYVTYSAADASGNTAEARRTVTVNHDEEDTDALVASFAAGVGDDVTEICNYVRTSISYSASWGDDDPVWYGLTNLSGNCYVHAACMKAVCDRKGIECQLIWTTVQNHFWLIVKVDGVWRHIDPTPGNQALKYGYLLMTDDMRQETLLGREWDRSAWPACE